MSSAWTAAALGDVAEITFGCAFDSKLFNSEGRGVPLIRIRDVISGNTSTSYEGTFEPRYLVERGDVLIGMDGEFNLGRWKEAPALLNQRVARIRSHDSDLSIDYLAHLLPRELKKLEAMTPFATVKHLSARRLRSLEIPLPPIEEQRRIAAILDGVDDVEALNRRRAQLLADLPQAMFEVARDVSWEPKELGDHLSFVTSGGRAWSKYYSRSGSRFIRSLDVRDGYLSDRELAYVTPPDNAEARRTRVQEGDVLLTITGSRIGRSAPVTQDWADAYVSQHVAILRPEMDRLRTGFLAVMLGLPGVGQTLIRGAQYGQTKPGLNFEQIRTFRLPIPPLRVQDAFLAELDVVQKQMQRVSRCENHLDGGRRSLQARAFSGRL